MAGAQIVPKNCPLDREKKERSVVVGAMHLLAMSWATLGALSFVEFKLGGEL
jgi:hypothetical protein